MGLSLYPVSSPNTPTRRRERELLLTGCGDFGAADESGSTEIQARILWTGVCIFTKRGAGIQASGSPHSATLMLQGLLLSPDRHPYLYDPLCTLGGTHVGNGLASQCLAWWRWTVVRSGLLRRHARRAGSSNATCSPSWIISGLAELEQFLSAATPGEGGPGKAVEMYATVHMW